MKAKHKRNFEILTAAVKSGDYTRIRSKCDPDTLYDGYVVGLSKQFVILHTVSESVLLNGYSVFPLREVNRVTTNNQFFKHRALQLENVKPFAPSSVELEDWQTLLASADVHFPVMALQLGRETSIRFSLGRVAEIKERSVLLRTISPSAEWEETPIKYKFRDITRIDFGGRYEAALWRVSQSELSSSGNP